MYVYVCAQCAGTRELAAMGPANIVFSFSQYVFQALQVASIRWAKVGGGMKQVGKTGLRVELSGGVKQGQGLFLAVE